MSADSHTHSVDFSILYCWFYSPMPAPFHVNAFSPSASQYVDLVSCLKRHIVIAKARDLTGPQISVVTSCLLSYIVSKRKESLGFVAAILILKSKGMLLP